MNAPPKTVVQKRRGKPRTGSDPVISFRPDHDLEWELHDWRYLQAEPPSRSRAIRQLIRMGLATAKKERADGPKDEPRCQ
jgi:hypothetical protein